ncbi:hypothetical protein F511_24069 [Dorcoceras hygrometricum]|uniref:Dystroglycan-like n=1 Tax=Dorcoceras hygrometricum TaxID=472368 RepID=A0A2Z7BEB4_9LAMI|nr:hypothetical protein F511_24069 [Dorcoceras hygrometricum]
MASSYYTNTLHVNFASVLAMDDPGMVSMFQALMASGLEGFLSCPTVIYEADLVDFFENASVREGMVVSTVHGVTVEISEQLFAETFELPVEGLIDLTEIPKDLVFDARSIVSFSGEPTISIKAGSFDTLTMEKFLMLTAIICEVKINWNRVLFNILKDMVTAGSRQAKGYVIQIILLLENIPNSELGESSEFPSSKILTEKKVHRYVVLNEKVGAEEVAADAPKVTRVPKKKAASKKRPAAVPVAEPVVKKKRTTKNKSGSSKENFEIVAVAQEAVPIQIIEPISDAPVVEPSMEEQREAISAVPFDEDISAVEQPADVETIVEEFDEPAVEGTAEEIRPPSTDDENNIIEQVLAETAHIEADEEDHGVGTSDVGDQPAGTADDSVPWFNLPYEVLIARDSERVFETASDTEDEEMETIDVEDQQLQNVDEAISRADAAADYFVEEPMEETETKAVFHRFELMTKLLRKFLEARKINFAPGDGASAVDLKVLDRLSDIHSFVLEELKEQENAHGLTWKKTCCLKFFEGRPRDRGAVIARTNTNTPSKCWIRTMILVDRVWVVEPCSDHWVKIPKPIVHNEVPRQLSYEDTLPAVSTFFKLMKKRWADVCLAVGEFFVSGKLLPVGSVNFCRYLEIVEPFSCFVSRQPTILSLILSQFCTVSVQYSLFNGLSIADIRNFFSSIVVERTALRDVQRIQSSVSVFPSVQSSFVSAASQNVQLAFSSVVEDEDNQMDIDQRLSSPTTTADSSMNFIGNDILLGDDATPNQPSLPTVATNLSAFLDNLRTSLSERLDSQSEDIRQLNDSQNDILSRLTFEEREVAAIRVLRRVGRTTFWLLPESSGFLAGLVVAQYKVRVELVISASTRPDITTLDKGLRDALLQQGEDLRKLIQNVLQDGRTLDDVQILRFNEFRKGFLAQSAAVTADSMDFRKEFRALNAKVTSLDEQVAATRNDLLEFSAQAQETLNHITDQLSELIAYINSGGNVTSQSSWGHE